MLRPSERTSRAPSSQTRMRSAGSVARIPPRSAESSVVLPEPTPPAMRQVQAVAHEVAEELRRAGGQGCGPAAGGGGA